MSELVTDQTVPDGECWYRVLTNRSHLTKARTIHYQALKGRVFSLSVGKPWTHELSGRLVSLSGNIAAEAAERVEAIRGSLAAQGRPVPSGITFSGIACATGSVLRTTPLGMVPTDVVYTPASSDSAHSDFVTYQTSSDEDLDPIRAWLMKVLHVIAPPDVDGPARSCGRPSASTT